MRVSGKAGIHKNLVSHWSDLQTDKIFAAQSLKAETTFHYCWRVKSWFKVVWMESTSPCNSLIGYSWSGAATHWSESIATLPPFDPIEGQKWFDRISSQWESQKNRFALIYFGKIRFLPPCIWNIPFMSYRLGCPQVPHFLLLWLAT
jgi:hypothetical protein